jgi:hypothetical protein
MMSKLLSGGNHPFQTLERKARQKQETKVKTGASVTRPIAPFDETAAVTKARRLASLVV